MKRDKFYSKYCSLILGYIQKLIKEKKHMNPEDVFHDFIETKLRSEKIDEIILQVENGNMGFLMKAVKNFTIDQKRKDGTKKNKTNKTNEIKEELLEKKQFENGPNQDECLRAINVIREKLAAGSKETLSVFELWYEEYSNPEIADRLGMTTKQVEYQKHKIRKIAKGQRKK